MSDPRSLGDRLALARALVPGLTAKELARLAGLSPPHVHAIETGLRPRVETRTASALADVLGVSLDWLVRGLGRDPSARRVRGAVADARTEHEIPPSFRRTA